jgi:hypothetical protein
MAREASVSSSRRLALWGWLSLVAGVLGIASAIFLIVVEPAVGDDTFSYPLTPGGFAVIQVWFFVHHLGLLAGLYGLWRSGAVGPTRLGRWGVWGAMVGMGSLAVTELVAISGADPAAPSDRLDTIQGLYGISSTLIGLTLIMAGIAVIRTGRWRGWRRVVPVILGVYVFVPLTPALFGPYVLARLGIGGWMLGFSFLGWALLKTAKETAEGSETPSHRGDGGKWRGVAAEGRSAE